MSTKQAIKKMCGYCTYEHGTNACKNADCEKRIYVDALLAQQEREKGCEYCKVLTPECRIGFFLPSIDPDSEADVVTISHCPMCGKRLEVEP